MAKKKISKPSRTNGLVRKKVAKKKKIAKKKKVAKKRAIKKRPSNGKKESSLHKRFNSDESESNQQLTRWKPRKERAKNKPFKISITSQVRQYLNQPAIDHEWIWSYAEELNIDIKHAKVVDIIAAHKVLKALVAGNPAFGNEMWTRIDGKVGEGTIADPQEMAQEINDALVDIDQMVEDEE